VRTERGPTQHGRQVELEKAKSILSRELPKHAGDPDWLEMQGRAHLLDWAPGNARSAFDQALKARPNDPSLTLEMATALYELAKLGENAEENLSTARDLVSNVLAQHPKDLVALFNRATINEDLHLTEAGIRDCEEYLALESQGPWSTEVKARLDRLKKAGASPVR
jgi:cytochrome c-type biogenesis protein CcmH/NrfG